MSRLSFGNRVGKHSVAHHHTPGLDGLLLTPNGPHPTVDALCAALAAERRHAAAQTRCTAVELVLGPEAVVPLLRPGVGLYAKGGSHDLPAHFDNTRDANADDAHDAVAAAVTAPVNGDDDGNGDNAPAEPSATIYTVVEIEDLEERKIVQRAAARGLLKAMQKVDGYVYNLNNVWAAKDADGFRFSYTCQRSMQNRGRNSNGSIRPDGGPRGVVDGPPNDCLGSLSMKFSRTMHHVEVFYRHFDFHPPAGKAAKAGMWSGYVPPGQSPAMLAPSPVPHAMSYPPPPPPFPSQQGGVKRKRESVYDPPPAHAPSLRDLLIQSELESSQDDLNPVPEPAPTRKHPASSRQRSIPAPAAVMQPSHSAPPAALIPTHFRTSPSLYPPAHFRHQPSTPAQQGGLPADKSLFLTLKPMFSPARTHTPSYGPPRSRPVPP